jgi:hypothetical protein
MDEISRLKLDLLRGYIKELRLQGYDSAEIKKSLIKNGAPRNLVNEALKQLPKTIKPSKVPKIIPKIKRPKPVKLKPVKAKPSGFFKPKPVKPIKPAKPTKATKLEEQIVSRAEAMEKKAHKPKGFFWAKRIKKKPAPVPKLKPKLVPKKVPKKLPKLKKPRPVARPVPVRKPVRLTPKHHHHVTWYILVIVIVALLGLLYFFMMPTNCGTDSACFIESANNCDNAVMTKTIETANYKFRTNNCVLEKEIKSFSAEEPDAVKKLFTGLSMDCSYEEGKFDVNLINSLTGGLDKCTGKLKDTVLEVRRSGRT